MPAVKELELEQVELEEEMSDEECEEFFGETLRQADAGQGSDVFVFLQELKEKYIKEAKERGFL